MLRWTAMVGLFLRCLDPRREGGPLYRHATSESCNHQAGPSHRQPPLSRTQPLRSGSNRTRWRCRCSPCRRGSGSSHRTPLHQLVGARVVSCRSGIGGNIGSGTGDQRYCSLGRINKGGNRRARVVRWSGVIGRGSGGGNVDRRYCCPCCVGGEGG